MKHTDIERKNFSTLGEIQKEERNEFGSSVPARKSCETVSYIYGVWGSYPILLWCCPSL